MATPRQQDLMRLKRMARYLKGRQRLQIHFPWLEDPHFATLVTDSDWANDKVTRRSNSGGVLLYGRQLIQHWTRVQPCIALSSGEAELYSAVRGVTNLLGYYNLLGEMMDRPVRLEHRVDASACKGAIMRKGAGTMKHLDIKTLWIQEAVATKGIKLVKIPRQLNPADSLASYSSAGTLEDHMTMIGAQYMS